MDKRGGGGREGYHDFLSKSFLFPSAEKFRRELFSVSLNSGIEKKA